MQIKKIENFMKYPERKLYKKTNRRLKKLGYSPVREEHNNYLYAEGDLPVLLVAHTDTVHYREPDRVYFDPRHGVMWSPEGLGADDRAGVFAVMEIVNEFNCGVLFCSGEESGGIGVKKFIKDFPYNPKYKMVIELDRCSDADCVFYDNGSYDFMSYVEGFGFKKAWGSFSDISILGPAWRINSVNLSVGYNEEHTKGEHLFVSSLFDTIEKVRNLLSTAIPEFEYRERISYYGKTATYRDGNVIGFDEDFYHSWDKGYGSDSTCGDVDWCDVCHKNCTPDMPMKEIEWGDFKVCSACLISHCFICESCKENFLAYYHKVEGMCDDCWEIYMNRLPNGGEKDDLTVRSIHDKIGEKRGEGE